MLAELERILASRFFKTADVQSRILRYVVQKHLAGESIKGADIKSEIPGHYDVDSHKERANASIIRKKIRDYYETEGKDNLVRLELPPGPSYRPSASYHEKAAVLRRYRQALDLMRKGSRDSLANAVEVFELIEEECPAFLPVYVSHAECRLLLSIARTLFDIPNARDIRVDAGAALNYLGGLPAETGDRLARVHLIAGAAHLLKGDITAAESEFELALKQDHRDTSGSLWYAAFLLLARNDYGAAYEVARVRLAAQPESFAARVAASVFLYCGRDYVRAANCIADIYEREGGELYEPLIIGLANLAAGRGGVALKAFSVASEMSGKEWDWLNANYELRGQEPDRLPGFIILALVSTGNLQEASRLLATLRRQKTVKDFDLMAAHMAVGSMGRALIWYWRCAAAGNVVAYWLELLPCFDALTRHPRFRELKEDIRERMVEGRSA
jgi:hypothetical protein